MSINPFLSMNKLILFLTLLVGLAACTWDTEEDLYPDETGSGTNCDGSTEVTFSETIQPIITSRCVSCHSTNGAANLGGGIRLDSYENIKIRADNGSLLGTIKHSPGYPQMPQGSSKLSDCQISLIELWIEEGTLNN